MDSENQEVILCPEDDENRVYCNFCDKLCIEDYYKNHLISGAHLNNFYEKQRSNNIIYIKYELLL